MCTTTAASAFSGRATFSKVPRCSPAFRFQLLRSLPNNAVRGRELMATKPTWTVEEIEQLDDDGVFHEVYEGELITLAPVSRAHGEVEQNINLVLTPFVRARKLGRVFPSDVGF